MANEFEKEMLKGTKSVEELLKEEKEEPITIHINLRKEHITRVKIIALHALGYHPLTNPSTLSKTEKNNIMNMMRDVLKWEDNDIINMFNKICIERLFASGVDYTQYPVYDIITSNM